MNQPAKVFQRLSEINSMQKPVRPLGQISDAICKQLPLFAALEQTRANLEPCKSFLNKVLVQAEAIDIPANPVAVLDLKMAYVLASKVGLVHEAQRFQALILPCLKALGRPSITHLTYEDIILNNPDTDIRSFTAGETKTHETQFYIGHQLIESALESTIQALQKIVAGNFTALDLQQAELGARRALGTMVSFHRDLNRDAFQAYKPFFDTDVLTGQKGPSGAFTAKVPHVDVLLYGSKLPQEMRDYIAANKDYFPVADYMRLQTDMRIEQGAMDVLPDHSSIQTIAQSMLGFRQGHRVAVKKHIGAQVIGSAEGSSAARLLDGRIEAFKTLAMRG